MQVAALQITSTGEVLNQLLERIEELEAVLRYKDKRLEALAKKVTQLETNIF